MTDAGPASRALRMTTTALAVTGGCLCLALAALVTVSVVSRALGLGGVAGDFELVQTATALAIFAFLPFTQARRGNIVVDSFSSGWPDGLRRAIDGVYDLIYGAFMGLCAVQLWKGAGEAAANGSASMVLLLPLAPALYACALMCGFLALICVVTALLRWRTPA